MKHRPRKERSGTRRELAEALLAKYEISETELLEELRAGRLCDPELLDAAACLGRDEEDLDIVDRNAGGIVPRGRGDQRREEC